MKVIVPGERSVSTYDFVVFGEADSHGIVDAVAEIVELLDAEGVVAGSVDEFKADFVFEKGPKHIEIIDYGARVDLNVLDYLWGYQFMV